MIGAMHVTSRDFEGDSKCESISKYTSIPASEIREKFEFRVHKFMESVTRRVALSDMK